MIQMIKDAKYILIATHQNPDIDTMCSAIAIGGYLKQIGKKYKIFNISKTVHNRYKMFDNYSKITSIVPAFYDLVIYVDCANKQRVAQQFDDDAKTINIDHHILNDMYGDINIVDDKAVSCGLVVYDIFEKFNITIDTNMANALYLAIYDDSFAFTKYRTSDNIYKVMDSLTKYGAKPNKLADGFLSTLSVAKYRLLPLIGNTLELHNDGLIATIELKQEFLDKTDATINECDDYPYEILKIKVVDIVCFFKQLKNNNIKVSIRAKRDIDLREIATIFGGGGHISSVSFTLKETTISETKKKVIDKLKQNFKSPIKTNTIFKK